MLSYRFCFKMTCGSWVVYDLLVKKASRAIIYTIWGRQILCGIYFDADQCFIGKELNFTAKIWIFWVPMGLIWVKNSAMVLIYCPIISIWHARCDKNPLATYQSQLERDLPHLRNGLYWKTDVFQFFAFYDFGHPKWPPNGKIWTWVVIGHMSGYV